MLRGFLFHGAPLPSIIQEIPVQVTWYYIRGDVYYDIRLCTSLLLAPQLQFLSFSTCKVNYWCTIALTNKNFSSPTTVSNIFFVSCLFLLFSVHTFTKPHRFRISSYHLMCMILGFRVYYHSIAINETFPR